MHLAYAKVQRVEEEEEKKRNENKHINVKCISFRKKIASATNFQAKSKETQWALHKCFIIL